jgi:hypothetical protein
MSAVGTVNSYASDIPSLLIGNSFGGPQASAANADSSQDRDPATFVDLSDRVKQTLSRAISDRGTADRLRAFVEQRGLKGANASAQDTSPSSDQDAVSDVTQAFEQLSGGTSAGEFSTAIGSSDGVSVQSYQSDNEEYITFSDSEATATNVTALSNAGTISTTSVGTHTGSMTFVVDFATGVISMEQAESTSVATSVLIGSNQSTLSTLA